jgi:hypothetical protein
VSGQAYRSTNDGQSFSSLSNSTLLSAVSAQFPSAQLTVNDALVNTIYSVDADFNRFWFLKADGFGYWTTRDAGVSFQFYTAVNSTTTPSIQTIVMHETNADVAAVLALSPDGSTGYLYVTVNFGASWTLVRGVALL